MFKFESKSDLIESQNALLLKNVHSQFLEYCRIGDTDSIRELFDSGFIDIDYNEGIFFITAAREGQLDTLRELKDLGIGLDKNIATKALWYAAHANDLGSVKFLVEECGADIDRIKKTTAYSNYPDIKDYFDSKLYTANYKAEAEELKAKAEMIKQTHWKYSGYLDLCNDENRDHNKDLYIKIMKDLVQRYKSQDEHFYGGGHEHYIPDYVLETCDTENWVEPIGNIPEDHA